MPGRGGRAGKGEEAGGVGAAGCVGRPRKGSWAHTLHMLACGWKRGRATGVLARQGVRAAMERHMGTYGVHMLRVWFEEEEQGERLWERMMAPRKRLREGGRGHRVAEAPEGEGKGGEREGEGWRGPERAGEGGRKCVLEVVEEGDDVMEDGVDVWMCGCGVCGSCAVRVLCVCTCCVAASVCIWCRLILRLTT